MQFNFNITSTPTNILTNDAWFTMVAVLIGLLTWGLDRPSGKRGKHIVLPTWFLLLALNVAVALAFFLNQVKFGKIVLVVELTLLGTGCIAGLLLFIIVHKFEFKLREGGIHKGIGSEPDFS